MEERTFSWLAPFRTEIQCLYSVQCKNQVRTREEETVKRAFQEIIIKKKQTRTRWP